MNIPAILDLFEKCDFEAVSESTYYDQIWLAMPKDFRVNCTYDNGVSKCVFIPKGANYVIKVPFSYKDDPCEYYDSNDNTWKYCDDGYEFTGAMYGPGWDYCYAEAVLYNKAVKAGVAKAFCKTRCIGKVYDYPIYVQERAKLEFRVCEDEETTSRTKQLCRENNYYNFNTNWQANALKYYGEAFFKKLMEFIEKENLEDFHSGNIGYIGDRPVLLDFSSYDS